MRGKEVRQKKEREGRERREGERGEREREGKVSDKCWGRGAGGWGVGGREQQKHVQIATI